MSVWPTALKVDIIAYDELENLVNILVIHEENWKRYTQLCDNWEHYLLKLMRFAYRTKRSLEDLIKR